ncbi:MAG: hypothetical protein AAB393_08325, partial [Bacteroidota bacterium]
MVSTDQSRIHRRLVRRVVVTSLVLVGGMFVVTLKLPNSQEAPDNASMQEQQMAGTSHFLSASLNVGSQATNILAQVPDAFIENRGQWVPSAKFATRRSGLSAWFTGNSIGLILSSQGGRNKSALVWLEFERSAEDVTLEGENVLPTYYN